MTATPYNFKHLPELPYPQGFPLYWGNEESGRLKEIMLLFLEHEPLDAHQLGLLKEYLVYHIYAPCWASSGGPSVYLENLKDQVTSALSVQDLYEYLEEAAKHCIDPI